MNNKSNTTLGKKILYACVIAMSSLILLGSIVGIIGVWLVERPISDAAVTTLKVVEHSTVVIRQSNSKVDQALGALEAKTTEFSDASQQLSQNITDKGLVMVLLPEEKEQQLTGTADSVRDTFSGIRDSIASGLELYRSINRIPFVSLPGLSDDQMEKIENTMAQIQALVGTLRSEVADFRSGVTGAIDKLGATANLLTEEINSAREALALVDPRLAALEVLSTRLQQVIPVIILTISVITSLILAFLVFTQVEVIRLYVARWRLLGQSQGISPTGTPAQPAQEIEGSSEIE